MARFMRQVADELNSKILPGKGVPSTSFRPNIHMGRVSTYFPLIWDSEFFLHGQPLERSMDMHYKCPANDIKLPKKLIEEDALVRRLTAGSALLHDVVRGLNKNTRHPELNKKEAESIASLSYHLTSSILKYFLNRAIDTRLKLRYSVCHTSKDMNHKLLCGGSAIRKELFDPESGKNVRRSTQNKGIYFVNKEKQRSSHHRSRRGGRSQNYSRSGYKGQNQWFFRERSSSNEKKRGGRGGRKYRKK